LVRLRVQQVNQIGVGVVHIPSLTSVQEGVSFSVAWGAVLVSPDNGSVGSGLSRVSMA